MKLRIGHLYPDLLNLYADRGNIMALKKRMMWRGIECEVVEYRLEDPLHFDNLDILLLGGGSDREQKIVCDKLYNQKSSLDAYINDGRFLLGICGGYQLLGEYYQIGEDKLKGLSLVDMYTVQKEGRLIGNIVLENSILGINIVGFENHGGRTYTKEEAFGKVIYGYGNNEESGQEGIFRKNMIGTYLHGPLLPKNPVVTDYVIQTALERKYGSYQLEPLDDSDEQKANTYMIEQIKKEFINR